MTIGDKRFVDCALTIEQECQLCARYKEGARPRDLMVDFGIAEATYQRILQAHHIPTRHKRIYSYDETFFDSIDSEAQAYFLGLLTADGYICANGKRYAVQLFLTDEQIVVRLRNEIHSTQPIYKVDLSKWNGKTGFMLVIGSKHMVNTLITQGLGPGRKQGQARFSHFVPDALLHHYIRGIFDGDGSVGVYHYPPRSAQAQWSLSGSEDITASVRGILADRCGLALTKIRFYTGRYILQYGGNRQVSRIGNFLYRDATIFLDRKKHIFPHSTN